MENTKTDYELSILINSMKAQFDVLEARIKQVQEVVSPKPKKFADFYGVLTGVMQTTDEEIEAVKFRFKENLI